MRIIKPLNGIFAVLASVGIVAQSGPAAACLSGIETSWTRENICQDSTTGGSSQGFIAGNALVANLFLGSLAVAGGFDANNQPVAGCEAGDTSADDQPGSATFCDAAAVRHNVQVNN